ncbi:condensation domain-containing protein [Paenibacillus sp. MER 180]|uniref:condensation domain-containing protein n=1 Tax=Paenibacillus sp. MER 180 TaxID=2939570 RepID=UPI00203CDD3F|nr:condensation domain-containing protein [Paenibacillus sp. MER 180]MCM3291422.1 condensation domain-containing protein [Paenibacillus sp. MER 180]
MNLIERMNRLPEDKQQKFIETIKERGAEYGIFPLANNQKGMWYVYCADFEKENPYYNPTFKIEFKYNADRTNPEKIKAAIQQLWETQDIFLFKYAEIGGTPYQYMDKDSRPAIDEVDLSHLPEQEVDKVIREQEREFCLRNFNLLEENPIRFQMIRVNQHVELLLIAVHHLISDGWSDGLVCKLIIEAYSGRKLEKSAYQYANYIMHEHAPRMQQKLQNNLIYWKEKLEQSDSYLDLPTVYDRCSQEEARSSISVFSLDTATTHSIKKIAKETMGNLHTVLLSLFTIVLGRYANKSMMNIGTTLANRDDSRYVNLVGDFASVIVMPVAYEEQATIKEAMEQVKDIMFESMEHSNVILSDVIENVAFQRREHVHPLYQIIFAVHSKKLFSGIAEGESIQIDGSDVIIHTLSRDNTNDFKLDLCAVVADNGEGLDIQFEYSTKLFSPERIESIAHAYIHFIREAVFDINQPINCCGLANVEELRAKLETYEITYCPKKLLNEVNIREEQVAVMHAELALLDESYHSVPLGFEGDIYFKSGNAWYATGEKGCIDENGRFDIIPHKSRVVLFNHAVIDLKQSQEAIRTKYQLDFCELKLTKENHLILFYDGDLMLYPTELLDILPVPPTLTYRTKDIHGSRINKNIKQLVSAVKELQVQPDVKDVVIVQPRDGDMFHLLFSTHSRQKLSKETIERIDRNNSSEHILFKFVEPFPMANGTIDCHHTTFHDQYTYPKLNKTETEEKVTAIWRQILGDDSTFGLHEKFFEAGGSSIKIIQMLHMLNKEFNTNVNIAELFVCNTIHEIAAHLDHHEQAVSENRCEIESCKF